MTNTSLTLAFKVGYKVLLQRETRPRGRVVNCCL